MSLFSFISEAHAQTLLEQTGRAASRLSQVPLGATIARYLAIFFAVMGIVFLFIVLYAGWLWMTAGGDGDKIKRAKAMVKNAIIGLIIMASAYAIAQFIYSALMRAAGINRGNTNVTERYSEPLSGALGAGFIEDHYPERDAVGVPRNTMIFVTFKEPVSGASFIAGATETSTTGGLNVDNVLIYPTATPEADRDTARLATDAVTVSLSEDGKSVVFDPKDYLGSAVTDTNYTVELKPGIRKANGNAAFTGASSRGYSWTFEVSTEIDVTPPKILSVMPAKNATNQNRNITVSLLFDEPMNPVAASGTVTTTGGFQNISISDDTTHVTGTFVIANGYRSVDFTPEQACGEDPCGDTIYCLPGNKNLTVQALAATLGTDPPQARIINGKFDGLTDAAGNSLDGNSDGTAKGSEGDSVTGVDHYTWGFQTNNIVNDTVPAISSIIPGIQKAFAPHTDPVKVTFSVPMKASTLTTTNISMWPDPWYEFWFQTRSEPADETPTSGTLTNINHPAMVGAEDLGWDYYPVITNGVKSAWQICLFPAYGPATEESGGHCGVTASLPYCCNGQPSPSACVTNNDHALPDTSTN